MNLHNWRPARCKLICCGTFMVWLKDYSFFSTAFVPFWGYCEAVWTQLLCNSRSIQIQNLVSLTEICIACRASANIAKPEDKYIICSLVMPGTHFSGIRSCCTICYSSNLQLGIQHQIAINSVCHHCLNLLVVLSFLLNSWCTISNTLKSNDLS